MLYCQFPSRTSYTNNHCLCEL